jgi:glycosyltransferase involved in cell wall biosynthesis
VPYVTILTPCYNEEDNVREVHRQVKEAMQTIPDCAYEHLFIDNSSQDHTVDILRELAHDDEHVKVIVNVRNFGHVRSPYHGFLEAQGDAVISCVSDLQDPPQLIPEFIKKWREGFKIVIGVKGSSEEPKRMFLVRRLYYWIVGHLSDVELIPNFTGFGLYDREVIEQLRATNEQNPYFRGLICDFGYARAEISYVQPSRKKGKTKNSFYSLYDIAMLGITNHSKVPLRIATMAGFALSVLALLISLGYLVAKLIWWNQLQMGLAPLLIGIYFFGSIQLFFIGILGEYIGSIHTQVHRRPLVIERERINFERTQALLDDGPAAIDDKVVTGHKR